MVHCELLYLLVYLREIGGLAEPWFNTLLPHQGSALQDHLKAGEEANPKPILTLTILPHLHNRKQGSVFCQAQRKKNHLIVIVRPCLLAHYLYFHISCVWPAISVAGWGQSDSAVLL